MTPPSSKIQSSLESHGISKWKAQGWPLFGIISSTLVIAELGFWSALNWSSPSDLAGLIGVNWRLAAPCFLLTFIVSPLHKLFPGRTTRWLASNRRYFGLAFAVVALSQLIPITVIAARFPPELADIHAASSQYGEDVIYSTLVLMTLTSFQATNRYIGRVTWRRLHATGMYLLAGLYSVAYIPTLFYPQYVSGFIFSLTFIFAWTLRIAVWWRRRTEFLRGWKLFWAFAGPSSGLMLASWSYFGIESDSGLQHVLSAALASTSGIFLVLLVATLIGRVRPGQVSVQLVAGRKWLLGAIALTFGWYIAFAVLSRLTLTPGHKPHLPLPLAVVITMHPEPALTTRP